MFNPRFHITNSITAGLTQIERARGFLEAAKLSEDWLKKMRSHAFILEAHHTTHIEGTRLTLEQAEDILAGREVVEADPDDVRELLNYRDAFEYVSEYLGGEVPITEVMIQEIHKMLVQGVRGGAGSPGTYRKIQNYVVNSLTREIIYTPPPPGDVPVLMANLTAWLNGAQDIHPVLMSGIAQFQLVHIHPFVDGNGRTSRLLSTLCLYRAGYDFKRLFTISEYYDRNRAAFYTAIQNVREHGMDLTGWLDYFVAGLATQMNEVTERGKRIIRRDAIVQKYSLSARQALAVGYLLENPAIRIEEYEQLCPGTNRRTLQRDIKELLEKGILKQEGSARAVRYRLKIKGL
jgi:Fic family protein